MIFDIEPRLKQLLAPFRNQQGRLDRSKCNDNQISKLEKDIITLINTEVTDSINNEDSQKLRKTWMMACHPDKGPIKKDILYLNKPVISATLMCELDLFFSGKSETDKNHGAFFKLIQKGFQKGADSDETNQNLFPTDPSLENFIIHFETALVQNGFYKHTQQGFFESHFLIPYQTIVFLEHNKNEYFVSTFEEWLKFWVEQYCTEVLATSENKGATYRLLQQQLESPFIKTLDWAIYSQGRRPRLSDFLKAQLQEIYQNGQLNRPSLSLLLPLDEAHLKYHLLCLLKEMKVQFRAAVTSPAGKVKVFVPGVVNEYNHPFSYDALPTALYDYYRFQLELSLRQILYADPLAPENNDMSFIKIHKFASAEYTKKQYAILVALFSENASDELLHRYGLTQETLSFMNEKACQGSPWNKLLDTTHWLYAHGKNAVILKPWPITRDQHGNEGFETYVKMYSTAQFNQLSNEIDSHPQGQGVKRFPFNLSILFWVSFLTVLTASSIGLAYIAPLLVEMQLFHAASVVNYWSLGAFAAIIIPVFLNFAPSLTYALTECLMDLVAGMSKAMTIPPLNPKRPQWVNECYAQMYIPFKRTLLNGAHEYYTGMGRILIQALYPLRVSMALGLAILGAINLITLKINQSILKWGALSCFAVLNLWFDWRDHVRSVRNFSQSFRAHKKEQPAPTSTRDAEPRMLNREELNIYLDSISPQPKLLLLTYPMAKNDKSLPVGGALPTTSPEENYKAPHSKPYETKLK